MTPIRALFFLAAITAACAGRIPSQVEHTDSLKTQIALLSHHRFTTNPVENAIEKFMELVLRIKERLHQLENELTDAVKASSIAVAKKINDFILKRTGVDLNLEERMEALEKKTDECNAVFETDVKKVISDIETETQTCAATQVAEALDIRTQVRALIAILEVVPAETIRNIKACGAPATEAPATEAPATEAPATEAPATEAPVNPDSGVAVRGHHSLHSWSDAWKVAKCVTKEVSAGLKELSDVPDMVSKLVSDAANLYNKETRDTLEKCAQQALAGKGTRVQLAAAQLAYCVIAPSQQQ